MCFTSYITSLHGTVFTKRENLINIYSNIIFNKYCPIKLENYMKFIFNDIDRNLHGSRPQIYRSENNLQQIKTLTTHLCLFSNTLGINVFVHIIV